ncbi:MAG: ABC transporter permease [Chloroflexota bacterium]|nr:MAG: ABC transporter permease [Chloroflexota bacterium]
MLDNVLEIALIVSLIAGTIRITTPILFAALGELVAERGGVLNLSVEGTMLTGALAGFLVAYQSGSLWLGVLAAMIAGGLLSLLMAFLVITLKVDQIVSGLSLNIFAAGFSFYIFRVVFSNVATENLPNIRIFEVFRLPFLSNIPVIGEAFFAHHMLTYVAVLLAPAISLFLYRTKYGLTLRCLGENPRAVDMKGVNVSLYQYLATIFGGIMAGLGGGFLTLASAGLFVPAIAAGRGWIAIAIVIFGNWKPINILLAALFFGFLDSFQLQIQGIGVQLPYQLLLATPYILTILALVVSRHRSGMPLALGVPYIRE